MAAGGVVIRWGIGSGLEVLLCVKKCSAHPYQLPKGTPHDGETVEQTALREVKEETGITVELCEPLGSTKYTFLGRRSRNYGDSHTVKIIDKTVYFFLMRSLGGNILDHDDEFDEVFWADWQTAVRALSFSGHAQMVVRAVSVFKERERTVRGSSGQVYG